MEQYFALIFEDVGHARSLVLIPSLTDPDILKQSDFTDREINLLKYSAVEKLYRQRILKEQVDVSMTE